MLGPAPAGRCPGAGPDPPMTDQETPTTRPVSPWRRLWRDWLAPHWGLLAVSLAMTGLVAVASAGYSKLIQLVMTAFQSGAAGRDLVGAGRR